MQTMKNVIKKNHHQNQKQINETSQLMKTWTPDKNIRIIKLYPKQARRNLTRMAIFMNLNYVIGNFFMYISILILKWFQIDNNAFSFCMAISNMLKFLSVGLNVLIYNYFNKLFNRILKASLKQANEKLKSIFFYEQNT